MRIDCEVKALSSNKKGKTNNNDSKADGRAKNALFLALRILGTLLLILVTTTLIFTCIFAVYVETNLSSQIGISMDDFKMNLSSTIYYEDKTTGTYQELVTLQSTEYRKWVDYDQIPAYAEKALVSIEDKRFYKHHGVDWYRTLGAFGNMFLSLRDGNFGGSSITQQLIKNLTNESEVTVQRKLLEIFRALQFEKQYSKQQIIEWYLNTVTFGGNRSGIGAAAEYYFGKEAKDLTLAECASIIGITNNPSMYNPYINEAANKERQENILNQMYEQGYITKAQRDEAISQKLVFKNSGKANPSQVTYTWFEDAVIEDVITDLMTLKDCSRRVAEDLLFTQGYKIYATIDPDIQAKVDSVYQDLSAIPKVSGSSQQIQSAIVIADPYTGDIVALEGGVGEKPGNRLFNLATQSRRPPGSSIKPLAVYAPAIENHLITPETRFEDSADVKLQGSSWMPKNDDLSYSGIITVREALRRSVNTVAAQIMDKLTPDKSFDFVTNKLGMNLSPNDDAYAPLALGQLTYGVTVREMAAAYTMFDNGGVKTDLRTYSKLLDSNGNVVYENKPKTTVAISDVTAYWVTNMLQDAAANGTGHEANLGFMPTAGKTGTTTDKKDRWFAGYTPYYTAVVWTGFPTPATMYVSGNPSAQLFKKVMKLIHEDLPYKTFSKPGNTYLSPIPGVDPAVPYIVRGVTTDGQVLYENTKSGVKTRDVTETAAAVDGYTIVGATEKTLTISEDSTLNVIEFTYEPVGTTPPPDTSEEPPTSPSTSPGTSPSTSPKTSSKP
ncbi:PBP1A family penicillin-binding protein [Oscillospiraceae bacterium WX1]